jgi:hypothetical protein
MGITLKDIESGEEVTLSAQEIVELLMKSTKWIGELEELIYWSIAGFRNVDKTEYEQELRVKFNEINNRFAHTKYNTAEGQ